MPAHQAPFIMTLRKPLLPECFVHWVSQAEPGAEDVLRLFSWRRNLTLTGQAFATFQARVIPLLDGTRDMETLAREVADVFPRSALEQAIDLLAGHGYLVEGDIQMPKTTPEMPDRTPQIGWLSENAPAGRSAQNALAAAHVVLFGAGAHGAAAGRALAAAGIGKLTIVDPAAVTKTDLYFSGLFQQGDIGQPRAECLASKLQGMCALEAVSNRPDAIDALLENATLAICCLDAGEMALALELNKAARARGLPLIAGSLEGSELVVGPAFWNNTDGPCYLCWRMREMTTASNIQTRYALENWLTEQQQDLSTRREGLSASADIVGGMLAGEVVSCLSMAGPSRIDGKFMVVALPGLQTERHTVLRVPGCPACGAPAERQP